MADIHHDKADLPQRKPFKSSRLGLYIVVLGWVAFLVTISQAFEWADFETVFFSFFSTDPKVLPFRALALTIPLLFTIIGYMVFMREQFLGEVITSGRKLESKNLSLQTSYKKLYGKMKEGVAGSAHTVILDEYKLLSRGVGSVLSDLMRYRIEHAPGGDARSFAIEDNIRLRAIMLLQEVFAKSVEQGKFDMRAYLRTVCKEVADFYNRPALNVEVEVKTGRLGMNHIFPCAIIVSELVMNSLKYAYVKTDEPTLRISLIQDPKGFAVLRVADNGSGIPEGMDISDKDTIGLKMASRMARAMKGSLVREDGVQGTAFSVTFNVAGVIPG